MLSVLCRKTGACWVVTQCCLPAASERTIVSSSSLRPSCRLVVWPGESLTPSSISVSRPETRSFRQGSMCVPPPGAATPKCKGLSDSAPCAAFANEGNGSKSFSSFFFLTSVEGEEIPETPKNPASPLESSSKARKKRDFQVAKSQNRAGSI